jgi:hypothetical protein
MWRLEPHAKKVTALMLASFKGHVALAKFLAQDCQAQRSSYTNGVADRERERATAEWQVEAEEQSQQQNQCSSQSDSE